MTAQEEITKSEHELDGARAALHDTMVAVNAKVEHAEGALRPARLINAHPLLASGFAIAAGYLIGSSTRRRLGAAACMVALLGYALANPSDNENP